MRVLTFTTLFPNRSRPTLGIFVRERMSAVARLVDLEVVAPVPWAPPIGARFRALRAIPAADETAGLRVRHPRFLSPPGEWSRLKPALLARGAWPVVRALHAEAPFDLVDAHFAHPDAATGVRLAERLGIPCVVSVRGSDIHRDLKRPALRPLLLDTLGRAAAVIAVAENLAEAMRGAGVPPSKIRVIENGVDTDRFQPRSRSEARTRLGVPPAPPLFLAIGKLAPVKGFDLLLDAFAPFRERALLWIVGEGPERAALEERAGRLGLGPSVRFLGPLPAEALRDPFAASDAFVLSSRDEGCPNVVLEALASGRPVAATRVGQVPYLVEEGRNGALASPGSPEELRQAMERVLRAGYDPARVRESVSSRTWPAVADKVRRAFEDALLARTASDRANPPSGRTPCSARS